MGAQAAAFAVVGRMPLPSRRHSLGLSASRIRFNFQDRKPLPTTTMKMAAEEKSWRDEVLVLPSGFKMAARIWGDPLAAPESPQHRWIALHGWADNAATFDRMAPLLLKSGATCVVALDAAGHGLSDHRWSYTDTDNVLDVVSAAESLGWDKYSVVGHSLGGCVAQALAATVPDKVARLIVIEALGWFSHDGQGALGALRKKALEEAAASSKKSTWTTYRDLDACAQRRAKQNMAGPMSVEDAHVLVARGTKPSPSGAGLVWTADAGIMKTRIRPSEPMVTEILSGIRCPHALVLARDGLFKGN